MKNTAKLLSLLLVVALPLFASATGTYQTELKKLNDFLKTIDNGFYGYFEVKDGYLYDRFASGKYAKMPVNQLGEATVAEAKRKVIVSCKDGSDCAYSTYTDSYHEYFQFSQTTDFNTGEFIKLFTNFINAIQGKTTATTKPQETQMPARSKYNRQLLALNAYLKIFNSETYGEVSLKDGKVYFSFKFENTDYYSSIPISDLVQNTTVLKETDEVKIACKASSNCFYSSYLDKNTDHFRFFSHSVTDLTKMNQLVQEFIDALK